jgi:hypothetical protein
MDSIPFLIWCFALVVFGYLFFYGLEPIFCQSSRPSKGTQPTTKSCHSADKTVPAPEPPAPTPEPTPEIDPRLEILTAAWQARRAIDDASNDYLRRMHQQVYDATQEQVEKKQRKSNA